MTITKALSDTITYSDSDTLSSFQVIHIKFSILLNRFIEAESVHYKVCIDDALMFFGGTSLISAEPYLYKVLTSTI